MQISLAESSKEVKKPGTVVSEKNSEENKRAVADNAFEKRQGLAMMDMDEDQLAMESQVHDQVAVESGRDQVAVETNNNNHLQIQQVIKLLSI